MKNLRILLILTAVSAVVAATAGPRHRERDESEPPRKERTERAKPSKPAESSRSSSQSSYTHTPATSGDRSRSRDSDAGSWGGPTGRRGSSPAERSYERPPSHKLENTGSAYTRPSSPGTGNSGSAYTRPSSPSPGPSQPYTRGREGRGDEGRDSIIRHSPQSPVQSDRGRSHDANALPGDRKPKPDARPGDWNRGERDRDHSQGDWNRGERDRDHSPGDWNRGDRDRDHSQGDWNRGDRDRDHSQGDWNRGERDRDHSQGDWNRGDRDRDHSQGDWNRDHRRDDRRHEPYDRVRDRDGWWEHHRYADKAYRHDGRRPASFWRVDWGRPYFGRYYDRWRYVPTVNVVFRSDARPPLLGSAIVAYDDTFLGIISRDWQDEDSISNPYGRFGCPESPWSIWNADGYWGSRQNFDSPWSPYATHPPRVYSGDYFLGYLTTNSDIYPRIDPYWLMDYLEIWVMD